MQQLLNYGFTQQDINNLTYVYNMAGKVTPAVIGQLGFDYQTQQRIMYTYKFYCGQIILDSIPKLAKHFRIVYGCNPDQASKMAYDYNLKHGGVDTKQGLVNSLKKINKNGQKITINDLATSKITEIPRVAVVANIQDEPYNIWNSNQYKGMAALYKVIDTSGQNITIETGRKPNLKYGALKKLPGILEIKGVKQDGKAVVTFNKNYCRLCNRFIIVASLRAPEFHLGAYEIICFEGTKVYIFASNLGTRENPRYNMGNQRVYDYGIFPQDIKTKLNKVAKGMYQYLQGMNIEYKAPSASYSVVPKVQVIEETPVDETDELF